MVCLFCFALDTSQKTYIGPILYEVLLNCVNIKLPFNVMCYPFQALELLSCYYSRHIY